MSTDSTLTAQVALQDILIVLYSRTITCTRIPLAKLVTVVCDGFYVLYI